MFEGGHCAIQGYNTTISVKLNNLKNDTETVYKYDFEFKKASPLSMAFVAQNGSVSQRDGLLIYTIQGGGFHIGNTGSCKTKAGDRYAGTSSVEKHRFPENEEQHESGRAENQRDYDRSTEYSASAEKLIPISPRIPIFAHIFIKVCLT